MNDVDYGLHPETFNGLLASLIGMEERRLLSGGGSLPVEESVVFTSAAMLDLALTVVALRAQVSLLDEQVEDFHPMSDVTGVVTEKELADGMVLVTAVANGCQVTVIQPEENGPFTVHPVARGDVVGVEVRSPSAGLVGCTWRSLSVST